ncbi:hypothetical protein ACFL0C_00875 [Patescibacteria group bacterium]
MQKGISAPLILVSVSTLIIGIFLYSEFSVRTKEKNVMGLSSEKKTMGFSVLLSSRGPWDFHEYLCTDVDTCERSLTSGKRHSTLSGVAVDDNELVVMYDADWDEYEYIKVYASPVWGSNQPDFTLEKLSQDPSAVIKILKESSINTEVLILPIEEINKEFKPELALFSNN